MFLRSHLGRLAAVAGVLAVLAARLAGQPDGEDELKSATLLAFVQNTHWKEPLAANSPITVGVAGRKPFLQHLRAAIEGKVVDGHPLRVLEVTALADPHCCQVLYFATDKIEEIAPLAESAGAAHVLTVGETDHFLDRGGAVNLFLTDGHMTFEVSLETLARSGIEISARLLRFGQIRERPKGRRL